MRKDPNQNYKCKKRHYTETLTQTPEIQRYKITWTTICHQNQTTRNGKLLRNIQLTKTESGRNRKAIGESLVRRLNQ